MATISGQNATTVRLEDIFAIQDEISLEVVNMLKVGLLGEEKTGLLKRHTKDVEAYNLYLRGRWFLSRRTREDFIKALEYFEKAIEKDPNYALAYTGLADSYGLLGNYIYMLPNEAYPKAKEAALMALELDDTLAEAHASLAFIKLLLLDWTGAEQEFQRAIELNPNYADAHHWYAQYLMTMARYDEALEEIKRAHELDPLSLIINRNVGQNLYRARQYDQAIDALQKTIEMDPNFGGSRRYLGLVYIQKSMFEKALEEFMREKDIIREFDPMIESLIGVTYALMGKEENAQQILEKLEARSKEKYVPSSNMALIYLALGENDRGFELLEKALEVSDFWIIRLKSEPLFDMAREDPRFKELLKKVNLE